ncbi:MAG: DUF4388 domain-containing protein [Deltaproteobacteria bacterium]|nr:DUF4388 domain-containing protein [Deltaproteobacteria bacterium]
MSKLALRFISGKYKGKEHILEDGKEVVVGRSSDADIVLMEDMVSRRHTLMVTHGGEIVVTDNGSTNGTFVNGEKISTSTAVKGDRILIGTSIMKVVDATDATIAHPTINSSLSSGIAAAVDGQPSSQRGNFTPHHAHHPGKSRTTMHSGARSMSGTIAEVPLPDLIQLFSTSKKTGTLVLNHNFTIAKIHLDKGKIIYASISDMPNLEPLKAMFRILSWEDGNFDLMGPEPNNFSELIELPTEHILMEGLRQLDELRREKKDMPSDDASVSIIIPLEPKLSELNADELNFIQLVLNRGHVTVHDMINSSELSDKTTIEILKKLFKLKYLAAEEFLI